MFSAKSGKVSIFLVKLYKRVFHPNVFSHMVKCSSLWGWEGNWTPTGHIALFYVWGLIMLHDALPFYCRLRA